MTVGDNTKVKVRNLVSHSVTYKIEEENIRRSFAANEEKTLTAGELRKLNYKRGGHVLLNEYLNISNEELANEFGVSSDAFKNEYSWDVDKVDKVLLKEPIEVLLDALDFAPLGILDLIQERAIALNINSMDKREAISKALNIDLSKMIEIRKDEKATKAANGTAAKEPERKRRVASSENSNKGKTASE